MRIVDDLAGQVDGPIGEFLAGLVGIFDRPLDAGSISIESVGQSLGLLTTTALEPEPIPLDVKVALTGDRRIYYLLCALDPEFLEYFKVQADFEETVDRDDPGVEAYARLIASLAQRERLIPLDAGCAARALEELARLGGRDRLADSDGGEPAACRHDGRRPGHDTGSHRDCRRGSRRAGSDASSGPSPSAGCGWM